VDTNLVWFHVGPELGSVKDVAGRLRQQGILIHPSGTRARVCTHLDASRAQVERAADAIRSLARQSVASGT
jgi:threonine aldolase